MMVGFFFALRAGGVMTSLTEMLALFEVLRKAPEAQSAEQFYFLAHLPGQR